MPVLSIRRGLAAAIVLACLLALLPASPARAAGYVNPFAGDTVSVGRTDMGVDVCLAAGQPIVAVGDGVVAGILPDWYAGQPYLYYELTDGPDAGRYVYVAEQIKPAVAAGAVIHAGDLIGRYAKHGSCLETGWSLADGETQAQASPAGYSEGASTAAGVSFARLLASLGVPGTFELTVTQPRTRPKPTSTSRPVTPTTTTTAAPATPAPASATASPTATAAPTTAAPAAVVHHATRRRTVRRVARPARRRPTIPTTLAPPPSSPSASGGAPVAGHTSVPPTSAAPSPWWQMAADPFAG